MTPETAKSLLENALTAEAEGGPIEGFAVLAAWFSREDLERLTQILLAGRLQGPPPPAFSNLLAEAASWAAVAPLIELRTYAWVTAKRLPVEQRAGLVAALVKLAAGEGGSC